MGRKTVTTKSSSAKKSSTKKKSATKSQPLQKGKLLIALGIGFLVFISAFGFSNLIPREFAIYYLIISMITATAYGIDKRAAINEEQRIPEILLHTMALLGGWPGALISQQLFRHKTIKVPFRIVFWGTVIINMVIFYKLLTTPEGTQLLKMIQ